MRTLKEILAAFKKDLKISYQAQKNIVDISEKYIHELAEADLGGKGGVDYTLTEQLTGLKWIDGKDIYQITYSGIKSTSSQEAVQSITSLGIDYVVDMNIISRGNTGVFIGQYYNGGGDCLRCWIESGSIQIQCGNTYPLRPFTWQVTLKYTKV